MGIIHVQQDQHNLCISQRCQSSITDIFWQQTGTGSCSSGAELERSTSWAGRWHFFSWNTVPWSRVSLCFSFSLLCSTLTDWKWNETKHMGLTLVLDWEPQCAVRSEKLWVFSSWECSCPGWMGLWGTWFGGRCPVHDTGPGIGWYMRSLPIHTIPWFCRVFCVGGYGCWLPKRRISRMGFTGQEPLCLLHSYSLPKKGFVQSYLRLQPHLHFWWGMNLSSKSSKQFLSRFIWLKYSR